jgi:hypothetical protein
VDAPETKAIAEPSGDGDTGPADDDQDEAVAEPAADADEADAPDTDTDTDTSEAPATEGTRLGQGVLAQLALNYLAERPGEEHTASAVGKALGRSAGAVANAFTKYEKAGEIVLACARPRRYRINVGG